MDKVSLTDNSKEIFDRLPISERLMYCTVRICCHDSKGQKSTGTGFCTEIEVSEGKFLPLLVTNKHVIKNSIIGEFSVHMAADENSRNRPSGNIETITIKDFESKWYLHPDEDVDLCVLPLLPLSNSYAKDKKFLFFPTIGENIYFNSKENKDLKPIEEIVMIGYPNGIWDSVNNFPVFRKGITATHPLKDYNGKQEFMIDAACFPGSSGSPVFVLNQGVFSVDKRLMSGDRLIFLGVLYAGPQYRADGTIEIINIPTVEVPIARTSIPNNLGLVIKSEKLLDFKKIFKNKIKEK